MKQTADHIEDIGHNSRMTPDEYRQEREAIRQGETRIEQQLARLFRRSGWKQQELAEVEGKSEGQICEMLRFGRFLEFLGAAEESEVTSNLSCRAFHKTYWPKTEYLGNPPTKCRNERQRFQAVLDLLMTPPPEGMRYASPVQKDPTPAIKLGRNIRDQFADGKWHMADEIAEAVNAETKDVRACLERWAADALTSATVETKKSGKTIKARIFAKKHSVSPIEIKEKLSPLIQQLREEAGKSEARISRATLGMIAAQLLKFIDQWESGADAGGHN